MDDGGGKRQERQRCAGTEEAPELPGHARVLSGALEMGSAVYAAPIVFVVNACT